MDMFLVFGWWKGQGWVPNTLIWVLGGWRGKEIPANALRHVGMLLCYPWGRCHGGWRVVMTWGTLIWVFGGWRGQGYLPTRYNMSACCCHRCHIGVVFYVSWQGGVVVRGRAVVVVVTMKFRRVVMGWGCGRVGRMGWVPNSGCVVRPGWGWMVDGGRAANALWCVNTLLNLLFRCGLVSS